MGLSEKGEAAPVNHPFADARARSKKLIKKQPPPLLVAEFLSEVRRLVLLLDEEGEMFWRTRLVNAEAKVSAGDWQGFKDFLAGYGTSGSFNECSIGVGGSRVPGRVERAHDEAKYHEFEELKNTAYQHARALARLSEPPIAVALAGAYRRAPTLTKVLLWLALALLVGALALGRP